MTTIGQLGTFDLENYGDLLYPLIFERILKTHNRDLRVRRYSFLSGRAPGKAGFVTRPVQSLFAPRQRTPSTLVIGGGDILRTDWSAVTDHYRRIRRGYLNRLRSFGTAGLVRYLLGRGLHRRDESVFYARRFRARWMNYSAVGPFLIDPADLGDGTRVSYLSCGVPHEFAPAERSTIKRIFDRAQFIYLRDEQSAQKLRRAGVERNIHVAPDLIVTLSDQFDRSAVVRRGREILARYGLNGHRPVLCFQSMPFKGFDEAEVMEHLSRCTRRTQAQVILLPLGFCHGDPKLLRGLAKASGGSLIYVDAYSVFDSIAVIAACDLFVGTSLHGNITAVSYGIPHLIGPITVDKAEGFLRVANLPPELKMRSWCELSDKIEMIQGLGPGFFSQRASEAKSRTYRAVNELIKGL